VAQLAQLLADAQADARQAESRVQTLQHRLRVEVCTALMPAALPLCPSASPPCHPTPEAAPATPAPQVLQSTEQVLENAGSVKHPTELARMYLRQLQFVLDQVQSL